MTTDVFHGQSTKENYRVDIEDSLKQKTIYKNYEYFDDYSYGTSDSIGFLISKIKDKVNLILFQSDGPKTKDIMRKLLEWRKSGESNEIGHKGGGNKRNIYGFKSLKTYIFYNFNNGKILRCETTPNKIFDVSNSNISEDEFRNRIDTSEFIIVPEIIDKENLPTWYDKLIEQIKQSDCKVMPNYIIRMELTDVPEEYTNKTKWIEYINQIRAKKYKIPIYFKNELLDMKEYECYPNIDMVGLDKKENEMTIKLFINIDDLSMYIYYNNEYINVNSGKIYSNVNLLEWGNVLMYVVDKKHLIEQIKEYNKDIDNTLKQEDVYGVYFIINDKLTNYKPIEGNLLGPSKNNGIKSDNDNNTSRFRIIFIPNNDTCKNTKYFNHLISTETIKALSRFKDESFAKKKIINRLIRFYSPKTKPKPKPKPIPPKPKPKPKPPNPIPPIPDPPNPPNPILPNPVPDPPKKPLGCSYIIYIGNGLWKYGMVTDESNFKKRINKHKNEANKKIKLFTNYDMKITKILICYKYNTKSYKTEEENIKHILEDNNSENKITFFQNSNSKNETREYFICNDFDYIYHTIIPKLP